MPQSLQETGRITEAAVAEAKNTGRMLIQHISPGWGSSGFYAAEVLEQAAADVVIPAGTQMFADHPTEAEAKERPVRSIKDLMSVTVEDARIATDDDVARGADIGGLVSEVDIVPTYRPLLEHLRDSIGVSIRGDGELVPGEAEGRTGMIVESLAHVKSVDWVTRAGRGGKVLSLVESARANARAVEHGLDEATVNDTREALLTVLRDAYGSKNPVGPNTYVWVRDFDDTTVWFEVDGPGDGAGLYAHDYATAATGAVALTGERTEVRVRTTYVPVTRPGSTTETTVTESQEDTMPQIQIEEAEHARLVEQAGRVTALEERATTAETARDQAIRERDQALAASAAEQRRARAHQIISEHDGVFDQLQAAGLAADLPLAEDGTLDEEAFTTRVDEAAARLAVARGAGQVTGFGGTSTSTSTGVDARKLTESNKPTRSPWGRPLTEKGA